MCVGPIRRLVHSKRDGSANATVAEAPQPIVFQLHSWVSETIFFKLCTLVDSRYCATHLPSCWSRFIYGPVCRASRAFILEDGRKVGIISIEFRSPWACTVLCLLQPREEWIPTLCIQQPASPAFPSRRPTTVNTNTYDARSSSRFSRSVSAKSCVTPLFNTHPQRI